MSYNTPHVSTVTSNLGNQAHYVFNNVTNGLSCGTVSIKNSGIELEKDCDIKIGDISLKEFMKKVESRLVILVPDPEKLEKFEALKNAYEHYKLLEKMLENS